MSRAIVTALVLAAAVAASFAAAAASEVPSAPTNFHQDGIGPFRWTDTSDNEDGFRVYVQRPEAEPKVAAEFPANTTSGAVPLSFEEQCSSDIWIVAFTEAGESAMSNVVNPPPPPSGCPATLTETYTNDTGGAAYQLTVKDYRNLVAARLVSNAPACSTPDVTTVAHDITVTWPSACVDPGESVVLEIDVTGPILAGTPAWTLPDATPAPTKTSAPTATAAPTATPAAFPSAGGPPASSRSWPAYLGLAIAAAGVLLLVRGGIAHRE